MSSSYSSLDWVLSHWAHFTVHRLIYLCSSVCILCFCFILHVLCNTYNVFGGMLKLAQSNLGPFLITTCTVSLQNGEKQMEEFHCFRSHPVRVWVAGKTVWSPCYTRAISERFRDKELIIKRYIYSPSLLYFSLLELTITDCAWHASDSETVCAFLKTTLFCRDYETFSWCVGDSSGCNM